MAPGNAGTIDLEDFVFDARPDTVDFRDRMYEPTLIEVPTRIDLQDYLDYEVPVLNQVHEGACTGFGLATVANYLLRKRKVVPDKTLVSPRMLYEMAKRYDEWPGEGYQGSSARGAMKGWHKHGICSEESWPYVQGTDDTTLTHERATSAARRPLGAYQRVNHKDLVSMHSALAEVGILFATGWVHSGWVTPHPDDAWIKYNKDVKLMGGHAFAIVAYNERGFWIQNSWGEDWGTKGFALLSYDDWLANGLDVWVARLGVPVSLQVAESTATSISPGATRATAHSLAELKPHIISIGNDGRLFPLNAFGTAEADVATIFRQEIPRLTQDWDRVRLILYAHGGLVKDSGFVQRIAEYRAAMMEAQVYPLAFVWRSDFWTTVSNILQDAFRSRRPEGALSSTLDFMLDRLDDTLEPLARVLGGKAQWDEMKENARLATTSPQGGARLTLKYLAEWMANTPKSEVHLVSHSAGSIFHAPLVRLLTSTGEIRSGLMRGHQGFGIPVSTCSLWAPGISIDEFRKTYLPAISAGQIQRFTLYTLTDEAEQDDNCAQIYNKSLLYLVSNALEEQRGTALLGMEKFVKGDRTINRLLKERTIDWVRAPNSASPQSPWASAARRHGDFDDDEPTLRSTLARILDTSMPLPQFTLGPSQAAVQAERTQLDQLTE